MDLGAKIKKYRAQFDMDQKTLAQKLNISPKTVSSWEVNRTQPKMEMIEAMCQVFGCKKTDFLDEDSHSETMFQFNLGESDQGLTADRIVLYNRLLNAASHCSYEELAAIITILEAKFHRKEKED